MYSFAPLKKAGTQNIQSSSRTFDTFGRESEQPPSGCTWPPRKVEFSASCLARPQSERSGQNKKVRANQKFQNFGRYSSSGWSKSLPVFANESGERQ